MKQQRQQDLNRMVTEQRAEVAARLLFPTEVPLPVCAEPCSICLWHKSRWEVRVRQVREAMQEAFK